MLIGKLKSIFSNCGGFNFRGSRFAGCLGNNVDHKQHIQILHSLILSNGVRKTTTYARNHLAISKAVESVRVKIPQEIKIIDIGSSSGIDATETLSALQGLGHKIEKYVLGDLYSSILISPNGRYVYDNFGQLLQVKIGPFFFSINFSYNFKFQKPFYIPQRVLSRVLLRISPPICNECVSQSLMRVSDREVFQTKQVDVFESLKPSGCDNNQYDIVICLHLLVSRYFDTETINLGILNLKQYVKEGGILIVGDRESPKVFQRIHGGYSMLPQNVVVGCAGSD